MNNNSDQEEDIKSSPPLVRRLFGATTKEKTCSADVFQLAKQPGESAGSPQNDQARVEKKQDRVEKGMKGGTPVSVSSKKKRSRKRNTPKRKQHAEDSKEYRQRIKEVNALNAAKALRYDLIADIALQDADPTLERAALDMEAVRVICTMGDEEE